MTSFVVPRRFCGPPVSGNGGWSSGALAALVAGSPDDHATSWPAVEVTLHAPPPLDTEMDVSIEDDLTVARLGEARVGSARVVEAALTPVAVADADEVAAATAAFPGWRRHAFPTCFTCGTERAEGDGLRVFPGPTPSAPERFAAPWTPHASTAEDWHAYGDAHRLSSVGVAWAVLDCPGGWAGGFADRPMVLGRMTARLDALPVVGVEHVVVGEHRETTGRKTMTATSLYALDGTLIGTAEQIWFAVDPALFS